MSTTIPTMQAFLTATPIRFSRPQTPYTSRTRPAKTPVQPRCAISQNRDATESSAMTAAAATFILKRAAEAYQHGGKKPRPATVLESLLQLERTQKRHHYRADMDKLCGQWRLIFSGDPRKKLQTMYFPVRAHQTFSNGEFDNGVFLFGGAFSFRVVGPFRFGKGNRMEFSVDRVKFKIGSFEWGRDGLDSEGYSLDDRHVKDLPFFTFFLLRDDLAAARGRSGGVALYARVPDDQHL